MSARDDYPILRHHANRMFDEGRETRRALDEIDDLREDVTTLLTLLASTGHDWSWVHPLRSRKP